MMQTSDSSSSSRPCGDNCAWKYNDFLGDWDAIHGCLDPSKWCNKPSQIVTELESDNYSCTECYSSEQFVSLARAASASDFPTARYGVIIRKLGKSTERAQFTDVVERGGTGQIYSSAFGWLIKVHHRSAAETPAAIASDAQIAPQTNENPLAVGLVLPEESKFSHHWLSVSPSQPWDTLRTPEWDVLVVSLRPSIEE